MTDIVTDKVLALREYYRKYREEHRDKVNAAFKKWYNSNKKTHLERTNKWRDENKEVVAKKRKERYDSNPEKYREKRKQGYWKDPEKARESAKKYQAVNPEKVKERKCAWYEANPERNRTYSHNRRARVRNVEGGHFTDAEFQEVCKATGNKCLCCGDNKSQLTADHVIPLGAPHTDEISNIQPLCLSCNSKKGTKTVDYRNP